MTDIDYTLQDVSASCECFSLLKFEVSVNVSVDSRKSSVYSDGFRQNNLQKLNFKSWKRRQKSTAVFNVKSLETDCMFVFMYLFPPHCNIIRIKPVVSLQPQILMLYFIVVVVFRITSNLHHTEAVCCTCPVYIRPSLSV